MWGYTELAIGFFPNAENVLDGSRRVVVKWWSDEYTAGGDGEGWESFWAGGQVDEGTALDWRAEVWPEPDEESEEDEE